MYTYDHVFQPVSTQVEVYTTSARPLVKDVLSGYNATIFAYGQTASGKTHTMEGVLESSEFRGIIPRIVGDIFEHIYAMDANLEIHIKISYFEIYMEKIRDLLDMTKSNLPIGESKTKVPYVKGITERFATSPEEVLAVVEEGKSNRKVAVTNMNAHSSRSHAVFLIAIKQENKETRQTLTGKLYLVDLAGSEKVEKTNAQGLTLEEAKTINKSLLALSNVIAALSEGNKPFIPYRDSKLTRVLQESLGGNARTTLIICCSPSPYNEAETKTTLMFGDRAKSIKNKVAVNVELTAEEWRRRFEKERETSQKLKFIVQQQDAELARWRAGESVPESERSRLKMKAVVAPTTAGESPAAVTAQGALGVNIPAAGLATPTATPIATPTPVQTRAFEEERTRLCQQLDEKEEELQAQSELVEKLTMKLGDIEENFEELQKDNATIKKQITVIEHELLSSQEEVHEVMQALEELAVSYDTKDREIGTVFNDKLTLAQENERIQSVLDQRMLELEKLRESTGLDRRKTNELLLSIFREVNGVSSILSPKSDEWVPLSSSSSSTSATPPPKVTDEDFTRVRVQLSNMRCEARSLTEQRAILEQAEREAKEKAQALMKEVANCKLKLSQYETHNETLTSTLKRSELQKRDLEDSLHSLEGQLQDMRGKEESLTRVEREREQRTEGLEHVSRELEDLLEDAETLLPEAAGSPSGGHCWQGDADCSDNRAVQSSAFAD
ncbi:Kinesin heavy chain [Geodia barretti]|nr:Kinesin heavy chain [Geodia barretti]